MRLNRPVVWLVCCVAVVLAASAAGAKTPKYFFELDEIFSGETLSMAGLVEDLPLVVFVWAPDCPHCKRHMPYVAALYKKLDPMHANFVSISVGESKQDAIDYAEEKELEFPILYAFSGTYGEGFTAEGWPTTFVFARGGKLEGWCDSSGPSYINEVLELVDDAN